MSAVSCLKEKREAAEGIAKLLVPGLAQSLGSSHATEEAAFEERISCLTSDLKGQKNFEHQAGNTQS